MSVIPVKAIEEVFTSTDETKTVATLSWCWADIENLLGPEWEIGGFGHAGRRDLGFGVGK